MFVVRVRITPAATQGEREREKTGACRRSVVLDCSLGGETASTTAAESRRVRRCEDMISPLRLQGLRVTVLKKDREERDCVGRDREKWKANTQQSRCPGESK